MVGKIKVIYRASDGREWETRNDALMYELGYVIRRRMKALLEHEPNAAEYERFMKLHSQVFVDTIAEVYKDNPPPGYEEDDDL